MKKKYLGVVAGIMLLAAGCASNGTTETVPANAAEASVAESQEETEKEEAGGGGILEGNGGIPAGSGRISEGRGGVPAGG